MKIVEIIIWQYWYSSWDSFNHYYQILPTGRTASVASLPARIKLLILDSVSGEHYPLSIAGGHIPWPLIPSSPSLLQAVVPDWWPIGEGGLGWAGQQNLQWPPSACECQQRAGGVSGSIRFATCLPTVSDRGGRQQRGGEQREVAQRRGRTTEEAGKIHLFIPALTVKSPVQFLFRSSPPLPHRLSLCPLLTQTPNPPPFTPHSFLNPKSLLPSLSALFQLFSVYLSVTHLLPPLLSVYRIWTCHLSP